MLGTPLREFSFNESDRSGQVSSFFVFVFSFYLVFDFLFFLFCLGVFVLEYGIHLTEEAALSCESILYYERYDPMVFWEAGKLASILRHRGDSINTGYPSLLQNLLRNENILNINIWSRIASLSVLSFQNSILLHCSWFILCTRQRFTNQVYILCFLAERSLDVQS